jgi:hypothetical protein
VGIVEDVRQFGLDREPEPQFFVDLRQWSGSGVLFPVGAYYALRTNSDPMAVIASVRRIVRQLDEQAALFNVAPMQQLVASTISRPRMYAVLVAIFAAAGLALALIGIYGVITSLCHAAYPRDWHPDVAWRSALRRVGSRASSEPVDDREWRWAGTRWRSGGEPLS